jgi:hypothetical protein
VHREAGLEGRTKFFQLSDVLAQPRSSEPGSTTLSAPEGGEGESAAVSMQHREGLQ